MTKEQITTLLEKFYDGTSTVSEERALRDYFAAPDCPPELEADRQTVLALADAPALQAPAALDQRIAARLKRRRRPHFYILHRVSVSVAAVAAVVALAFGLFGQKNPTPTVYANTCTTKEEAAEQAREILIYVSESLNEGLESHDDLGGPCP